MELPPINQRFKELIDWYAKGNVAEFSRIIGQDSQKINRLFHPDTRNKIKKTYPRPTIEIILAVTNMIPEVNHTWIMTGTPPMIATRENESTSDYGNCEKCSELRQEILSTYRKLTALQEEKDRISNERDNYKNDLEKIYFENPQIPRPHHAPLSDSA